MASSGEMRRVAIRKLLFNRYFVILIFWEKRNCRPVFFVQAWVSLMTRFEVIIPDEDIETKKKDRVVLIPRYHVVLWDDNDHTYDYVIEMLAKLFGHTIEKAFQMAVEVDSAGQVIVETTSRERAEFKQEQIHTYGADWRIPHCKGSMSATIEPAENGET